MTTVKLVNGVDVQELRRKAEKLKENPELARFHFHVQNTWLDCGHSQTTVTSFYGVGQENQHDQSFVVEADEPRLLLGEDKAANPVEHLLNALVTCLTASMAYHAAVRGIEIEELESTVEGDIDLRGYLGVSEDVRKGYQNIKVTFRVKSDAPIGELEECARFSPVFDTVTHETPVDLVLEKK